MNSNVYCIILKDSHSVASGIIWNIGVRTDTITVIFMHVCARARNRVVSVCICLICFSFNYIRLKTNVSSLLISNLFQLWILFFPVKIKFFRDFWSFLILISHNKIIFHCMVRFTFSRKAEELSFTRRK